MSFEIGAWLGAILPGMEFAVDRRAGLFAAVAAGISPQAGGKAR